MSTRLVLLVYLLIGAGSFMLGDTCRDTRTLKLYQEVLGAEIEAVKAQQAHDSLEMELRFWETYVRPDSAVVNRTLVEQGLREAVADSVTRWIVAYGMQTGVNPRLLTSVAWIESKFDAQAVSYADAHGMFQVVPLYWYNVYREECGWWNPYDRRVSTCYGAHILRYYYDVYGDWPAALSAYNSGYGYASSQGRRYAHRVIRKMEGL